MIVDDPIIHFAEDDIPDLPELHKPKKCKRRMRETPPPTDWRPHGEEW